VNEDPDMQPMDEEEMEEGDTYREEGAEGVEKEEL
jgi:hypothetical protein